MKLQNKLAFITGGGRGIGRAIAIAFAREGAAVAVTARTREHVGRGPDLLVNNAGIAESELFIKTDELMWERHLNTNLGGTFRCTHAALPEMVERGWGRIINIASIAGKTGAPYISAYAASKHAVLGLTRSLV